METKRLEILPSVPAIRLNESAVIKVGKGESRYFISQESPIDQHYVFELTYPSSRLYLTGLVQAQGKDLSYLQVEIRHLAENTEAETLIKTVVRDSAQPKFEGLIYVAPSCFGCASFLNHHSLLLSPSAHSWSRPSLEILNDNVRCSHSATVRHIKDRDLFYSRAHSFSYEEARQIYIEAFTSEVREDRMQKRLTR